MQIQTLVSRALKREKSPIPPGLRSVPRLSGAMPVLGHTVDFVRATLELLHRARREMGEVAAFQVGNRQMVAMFGPDAHEAVFRAPDAQLNPSEAYKIMTPVFGKNMVYDAPPKRMNEQLKMLLPALKDRRMRTYGDLIVQEVERSIADWGERGEIDLVDYCRELTNYTSAHCLLGREFRENMTGEFARIYQSLERGVTPIAYISPNLPLPSFRERDRARVRLVEMIGKIIEDRRASKREGEDFLQTLMDASYQSGDALTDDEITGMLLASMFAGHHTSSVTTAWTLLELAQNPTAMDRVLDELGTIYRDDAAVEFGTLRQSTETEYAVKEALRLHPPLFMLVRVVMQDFAFKGYHIPKGTWIIVSPTASHMLDSVFENAASYDPQRFAPPREEDKRDFAYIPFGGGRHKCMGNAFALLQVKAIVTILLQRYDFEVVGPAPTADFHGLVIGPKEPCRVRYQRRAAPLTARRDVMNATLGSSDASTASQPFRVLCDLDLCQSHAVCMGESPSIFRVSAEGKVELLQATPSPELRPQAELAAQHCPTGAIRVIDRDAN